MKRRFFLLLIFLAALISAPICMAADDDALGEVLSLKQQFPDETVRVKIEVRHVLSWRMVRALMIEPEGVYKRGGIRTFYTSESKTVFEVSGTREAIAALRERVKVLDTPPKAYVQVRVTRILPPFGEDWRRDQTAAPVIYPMVGDQAELGVRVWDNPKLSIYVQARYVQDENGSQILKAKAELRHVNLSNLVGPPPLAAVTGEIRLKDGSALYLMLAPPGEPKKPDSAATEEAKPTNPLTRSGIPFIYLMEITVRGTAEKPASEPQAKAAPTVK